jgi:hypothetical protein
MWPLKTKHRKAYGFRLATMLYFCSLETNTAIKASYFSKTDYNIKCKGTTLSGPSPPEFVRSQRYGTVNGRKLIITEAAKFTSTVRIFLPT